MGKQLRALLLLSPLLILGCDGLFDGSSEVITEEELLEEFAEFASRYDAVTDWGVVFEDPDAILEEVYTFEIEDALVRTDSRPVLILATLEDVTKENDTYFLHFSTLWSTGPFSYSFQIPELRLVLEGEKNLIDKVTSGPRTFIDEYAIIATISSVSNPTLFTNETSEFLVVRGHCVDLMLYDSL